MTFHNNNSYSMSAWLQKFRLYLDKRLFYIFSLGVASGFPYMMIGSAVSAWLKDEGVGRSSIGYIGAVFAAYSINFLWSPLVDRVKIPLLGNLLGQRKSWIISMQSIVLVCCFIMSSFTDVSSLQKLGLVMLVLAIAAATQDIAIDAFRIDSFNDDESDKMSAAAAMATSGWWTGFAGLGALPFLIVDLPGWSWPKVYFVLAIIMLALMLIVTLAKEPKTRREQQQQQAFEHHISYLRGQRHGASSLLMLFMAMVFFIVTQVTGYGELSEEYSWLSQLNLICIAGLFVAIIRRLMTLHQSASGSTQISSAVATKMDRVTAWIMVSAVDPIADFFRRNGTRFALSILLFIFLFKIGEAFLGRMSVVFYKEVGFTNEEIALYSKLVTWWLTIVFSLLGSFLSMRLGVFRGLFIAGVAMAASNLMFSWIAVVGPSVPLLLSAVVIDGFTQAWSSVAFVSFLSLMCNRTFSASQYALMASLATFGRTLLASYSGALVDWLNGNWALFFILTTVMIIPSLVFLYLLRNKLKQFDQVPKNL